MVTSGIASYLKSKGSWGKKVPLSGETCTEWLIREPNNKYVWENSCMRHTSTLSVSSRKVTTKPRLPQVSGTVTNDTQIASGEAQEEESNLSILVSFIYVLIYRFSYQKGPAATDDWAGANDDKAAAEWEAREANGTISGSCCLEIVGRSRGCRLRVIVCLMRGGGGGGGGGCCCSCCWICLRSPFV